MIAVFVREEDRYTSQQLSELLELSDEAIRTLKDRNIIKSTKPKSQQDASEHTDEDDDREYDAINTADQYEYKFTFVGVIVLGETVLKCYPKYLLTNSQPKDELKQILKVIEKYKSKNKKNVENKVNMLDDIDEGKVFNLLAVLLFFLNDYYENGVYNNTKEIIESNGSGEIFWDKTINETIAIISNNRPYYIDFETKKRVTDNFDYFKRLHECILTKASEELKEADLLDLFDLNEVYLTDEELDDFGEKDYILYRIENELNVQFNTRKQLVLKTIYAYIDQGGSLHDTDCLSFFGTKNFNLVWEDVCKDIFDNQLEVNLKVLSLPKPLTKKYIDDMKGENSGKTTLKKIIEKPVWTITGLRADTPLLPDLVTIKDKSFIIFDAKYYVPKLEKGEPPKHVPGIGDVTKQFVYQLAYKDFIAAHGFATVRNCFLIPTEEKNIADKKEVHMEIFSSVGLEDIKVRLLPADMAYQLYLLGKKIDIDLLEL